jgi:hypothetical protein
MNGSRGLLAALIHFLQFTAAAFGQQLRESLNMSL